MATRGPKPKPKAINDLRGDPGKRRRYRQEVEAPEGWPEMPDYLKSDSIASDKWQEICQHLETMKILSVVDGSAIEKYCNAYSRYRIALDMVVDQGAWVEVGDKGYQQKAPWASEADNQLQVMKSYESEFGLTPAARARVSITQDKKKETKNNIAKFMKTAG